MRQQWSLQRSYPQIVANVGCGVGTVPKVLALAAEAKLELADVERLDDGELELCVLSMRIEPTASMASRRSLAAVT